MPALSLRECAEDSKIRELGKEGQDVQDMGLVMINVPGCLEVVKNEESKFRITFKYNRNLP
jgi:hypothetical protein